MDTRTDRHSDGLSKDGVRVVQLSKWEEFHQEVMTLTRHRDYVWRGQRKDKPLLSLFDRPLGSVDQRTRDESLKDHLKKFKAEMKQSHPNVLPKNEKWNEIWALGQHYGLFTPLLDWSRSPYIAAYFAFEKLLPDHEYRYVYALDIKRLKRLMKPKKGSQIQPHKERFVDLIDTVKYPNPRFVAQNGISTKALNGETIEKNAELWSNKRPNEEAILMKIKIPSEDREKCLHELHLMNIDYRRLLLDLRDVVDSCNPKKRG